MKQIKKEENKKINVLNENVEIVNAGIVLDEKVTDTLKTNYMPYAMSVIVSRAIPEIDGLKPAHRKLLYTMYKMGLLKGNKTKSANIVGTTMRLNPHGDAAIYETMVRLGEGNEALLAPFVENKGNFGKTYSRDMAYAASRYTEAKLAPIAEELFKDIDKDTVDFIPNYDDTMQEPVLLPVSFPTILANNTLGIAVGMASNICSYNLKELCETTIELMKNKEHKIISTLPAPDFVGGGEILYNKEEFNKIIETGKGAVVVRSKYFYDKKNNLIEITEIPPTTTIEAIIDKITDLVKNNKIREINDIRDETDKNGLKIAIDLKRGQDGDMLMHKLFKMTPCQETFSCNFNLLIKGKPQVLGVRNILLEWIDFRINCVKRRLIFDISSKEKRLHLLLGLKTILLDIDKAINVIRRTKNDNDVIPNLKKEFQIDDIQAEYISEIKLRNLNEEYILKRISEIEILEKDIEYLKSTLASDIKIKKVITKELQDIIKKYQKNRKSDILYDVEEIEFDVHKIEDYPVNVFITKEGYIKKITPQSLRMSGEHKIKENDEIVQSFESTNNSELLFFTNKYQCYKAYLDNFNSTKASALGDYLPAELGLETDERILSVIHVGTEYKGFMLFVFENGKIGKVSLTSYDTKTNRKKLINAFSDKSKIISIMYLKEDKDLYIQSSDKRILVFNTNQLAEKSSKNTIGVTTIKLKEKQKVSKIDFVENLKVKNMEEYRGKLASVGIL